MAEFTHRQLVCFAARWLRGTRRCRPVICESNSCAEAPDAIGWRPRGSVVVECKTSLADLRREKGKYIRMKSPNGDCELRPNNGWTIKALEAKGFVRTEGPKMGTQRFVLCPARVLTPEDMSRYLPDHGLLYVQGKQVKVVIDAPQRDSPNYASEIRLLRLHWPVNSNKPHSDDGAPTNQLTNRPNGAS